MNTPICGYASFESFESFEYMIGQSNAWVSQEDIAVSNPILLSSYLALEKNVREIVKIEEVYADESDNDNSYVDAKDTTGEFWFSVEEKSYVCTTSNTTHFKKSQNGTKKMGNDLTISQGCQRS